MSSSDTIVFHLSTGKSSIGETCWMPAFGDDHVEATEPAERVVHGGLVGVGVR